MNEETRTLLRLLSSLLSYPGEDLSPAFEESVNAMPVARLHGRAWETCALFLARMDRIPLLQRMETYTETFDFSPGACLDLTRHRWPEEPARRNATAHLHEIYRQEGYGCCAPQMPDHLPVLLEFLSVCSGETRRWIATTYRDSIAVLARRLRESASPYACLFHLTLSLFDWLQVPEQEAIWTGT